MSIRFPRTRHLLATALAGACLALAATPAARAEAPQVRTQVPGWYRQMLGGFEVTALYDGQIMLDTRILKNASQADMQKLLARMFRNNPTATAVNGYLVNTGSKLVLVDAGAAGLLGPTLGHILESLKAAGYTPEQVDVVLLTHLHPDHAGGLTTADGRAAFPNATVHAAQADADFWLSEEHTRKAPKGMQPFFRMSQASLKPYVDAGRFKPFSGEVDLLPGIRAVSTAGHTPGHTSFLFDNGGQKLLVWGDVVHNAAVQFPRPGVAIEFDIDPRRAVAARRHVFDLAETGRLLVAGAHLPFPGLGHVRKESTGRYEWVPVDFAPIVPAAASVPAAPASR